jgi:Na+/H+ antiporter NhaD/arsenite permease-like protein
MTTLLFAAAPADPVVYNVPAMIVLGLIMVATYVCIAFEWLHKSIAALLGAMAAVAAALWFGLFRPSLGESDSAYDKAVHQIIGHDLNVIGVLIGTSVLVEIAGRSGLFHFLAVKIVKQTRGDPGLLFLFICLATVLFVTFLTIAPGTLIMVSLVLVVTKELELDPKPYILAVAICANSGALMTLASGVCTLMIGTAAPLPYLDFFRVSTPMALISAAIVFFTIRAFYKSSLVAVGEPAQRQAKVAAFDEWALVKDRALFYRCIVILGGTIVGFALAQPLGVGLDYIAFAGATAALLLSGESPEEAIKKVNWSVILFFVGLFVIIGSVRESGLLNWLARIVVDMSGGNTTTAMVLVAVFVLIMSGLVDNIPVAATLIPVIRTMEVGGIEAAPLWWTLVLAANLGGNSTPVGSISSVIAVHALEKERNIKIGWGEFIKVGGTILVIQGVVVIIYLLLFSWGDLFPAGTE